MDDVEELRMAPPFRFGDGDKWILLGQSLKVISTRGEREEDMKVIELVVDWTKGGWDKVELIK